MKKLTIIAAIFLSILGLTACNSSERPLVSSTQKPVNMQFEVIDLEGIGKAEMPKGDSWEKIDNEYYNAGLDMSIITQSQPGNFLEQMKEYTDSYIEVNKRDAPQYEVIVSEEGTINSIKAVRVDGKFNNGTAYVTRDYLFFTPEKVVILMSRADVKNIGELNTLIDYIASTVKK